jgi:hypothetical protein
VDTHVYYLRLNNRRRHCLNPPLSRRATPLCVGMLTPLDHLEPSAQLVHVPVASVRLTIESFLIIEIEKRRGGALQAVWYRASCDIAEWRDFDRQL